MKFVFFSVSENGDNGLGDEGADEGNAPRILGLELPLNIVNSCSTSTRCLNKKGHTLSSFATLTCANRFS